MILPALKNNLNRSVALSVRQPWTWALLHAGKDIENRDWRPSNPGLKFRGECFLHSSLRFDHVEIQVVRQIFRALDRDPDDVPYPSRFRDLKNDDPKNPYPLGGIVGVIEITDVITEHGSRWFFGHPYGLVVANATPLPFFPLKGKLGFFPVTTSKENM